MIFRSKPPEDIQIDAPELSERQRKTLDFIEKLSRIMAADLQELTEVIERTA